MIVKVFKAIIVTLAIIQRVYAQTDYNCANNDCDPTIELTRNRLKDHEPGFRYGGPYTMFNRTTPGWSFDAIRLKIMDRIKLRTAVRDSFLSPITKMYRAIVAHANQASPPLCEYDQKECQHPKWVKNNAIAFFIGLKDSLDPALKVHLIPMTDSERIGYFLKAQTGLRNLNFEVISCWGGPDCGIIRQKAMQLASYLQTYDLLKSYGEHWGVSIAPDYIRGDDRNKGTCSPRNKLRELTKNVYLQSDNVINSSNGWKRNHGIICASVLGLAAIVLNDAGAELNPIPYIDNFGLGWVNNLVSLVINGETPSPEDSPIKWMERAIGTTGGRELLGEGEDGLYDNFFVGHHWLTANAPQTNAEGTSGYAEGPGYMTDLLGVFLPFIRAADNALPRWNNRNPLSPQNKYINLLYWIKGITATYGNLPQYDNSSSPRNFLGVLGHDSFPSYPHLVPDTSSNLDLRGDYLLADGKEPTQAAKASFINPVSGDLILNNTSGGNQHQFHMLCEQGESVDPASGLSGITIETPFGTIQFGEHEDDDFGSFMLSRNGEWLAVDPPYGGWENVDRTNKYWHHNIIRFVGGPSDPWNIMDDLQTVNAGFQLTYRSRDGITTMGTIKRRIEAVNLPDGTPFYYMLHDYVNPSLGNLSGINWQLNGNGSSLVGTYSYETDNRERVSIWGCTGSGLDYQKLVHHAAFLNGATDTPYQVTQLQNYAGTQLHFHQYNPRTIVQSFLMPAACSEPLPTIRRIESDTHVVTIIDFLHGTDTTVAAKFHKQAPVTEDLVTDTISHLHLARFSGLIPDSLTNPFNHPGQAASLLRLDGQKLFVKHHSLSWSGAGYKYCPPTPN
jgi:hypothetical protein